MLTWTVVPRGFVFFLARWRWKRKNANYDASLILDGVDEKEMIIVLSLLLWGSQSGLGIQWGESQEHESLHQVGTVGAILTDAQHDAIAVQLLFSELEKRKERLLAGFVCQRFRENHVQDVVVMIQDLITKGKKANENFAICQALSKILTESQLDEILSVTWSLMVMRVGVFDPTICEIMLSSSSLSLSVSSFDCLLMSSSISSSMNDNWWSTDSE